MMGERYPSQEDFAVATVSFPTEQRILLHNIPWQTYESLLEAAGERHIRFTYDRGDLEIMTMGHEHENYAELFARLVFEVTVELNIPFRSGGSNTIKRELKKRGLEPDKCYWIENEPLMRGKKDFDIESDPPPDLAIEVDITNGSLDRVGIYAAFGIPELWRYDGETIFIYRLNKNGKYEVSERSGVFPFLDMSDVLRFLRESDETDETSLVRSFRAWVRANLLPAVEEERTKKAARRRPRRPR